MGYKKHYLISRRTFLSFSAATLSSLAVHPVWSLGNHQIPTDLYQLTIEEAGVLLRQKAVSPVDLTKACLDRIERYNPVLNAFITVTADIAMAQAQAAEKEISQGNWRGPLHGIPLAIKDNIDTAGIRTTAASAVFADRIPTEDAAVVQCLKDAGAIILGKLNMDEFATGWANVNSHWGPVRNPWALDYVSGGSSGGSAAAVAADLCYGALGTDTGGSVRMPASQCGVVGLKPTYGLVSNRGLIPDIPSVQHVGILSKTTGDTALILQTIAGFDPKWYGSINAPNLNYAEKPVENHLKPRVGIPRANFFDSVDTPILDAMEVAIGEIKKLSSSVHDMTIDDIPKDVFTNLFAETYRYQKPIYEKNKVLYQPFTRKFLSGLGSVSESDYLEAKNTMKIKRIEMLKMFEDFDFLVMPTFKIVTPKIESMKRKFYAEKPFEEFSSRELNGANTTVFNILGFPAISVPCGFTAEGLPMGMQIVGAPCSEAKLLAFSQSYERSTNWHLRKPKIERLVTLPN